MTNMDGTLTSNAASVDLDKVIALFTGPNSAELYERHVAAISKLCRANAGGFAIRDLQKVQQVLELSLALLKRGSAGFVEPLCGLVSTLGKPFVRRTATDEVKMLNHITSLLTVVGDIFRSAGLPAALTVTAAQMVTTFASGYGNRPNALDLASQQPAEIDLAQRQFHTNQSLLHKSGIAADVITALARALLAPHDGPAAGPVRTAPDAADSAASASGALVAPLSGALLAMSYSPDNCAAMVECGVLQCLAALLTRGSRAETTGTAVELLWNVVEHAPAARAMLSRPLPSLHALARGAAAASGKLANGGAGVPGTAGSGGAGAAASAAAAGPGPGSDADRDLAAMASFSGMLGAGDSAATLAADAAGAARAPRSSTGATGLGSASGGGGGGGSGGTGGSMGGADDGWQQLPDGAAGGGAAYEASISLRAASAGGGAAAYDEFGDTPDLDLRLVGSGFRRSSGTGTGAASATAALASATPAMPSTPAPAPVVQALADALTGLLRALLLSGFSRADKELRNDVLVVLNLLLEDPGFRGAAAYAGAFEPLLAAGTAPELAAPRADTVAGYALTTDTLDHELRLLTWSALVHGCLLPQVLESAVAGGLVRVLLLYVSYGEGHPAVRRWNGDQLAALRAAALSKLHSLAPLCPEEYERAGGPATLLGFVAAAPGAAHMEAALRHLHRLFTLVPESRDALGSAGLVPILLGLVSDSGAGAGAGGGSALGRVKSAGGGGSGAGAAAAGGAGAGQPEPVRHFALLCLTALCSVHAENQRRLRKAGGVGVLLGALGRLRALDPLLPAPYAVAVLDCVWAGVVPDRKSAARFLVDQGLDQLLNHLEGGNRGHRPVVLRVLSDLLENPRSHPFFHEWRSGVNKQTAAHLLLSIWMEDDALRGMTGPDGLLANTARPLAGLEKRTKWLPPEAVAYGNMSPEKKETLELMLEGVSGEAVLAKIWGVFKLLGFDSFPYLDPRDHAVLAAVEKYAKFRQGEVWRAIRTELDASELRPTAPDRLRLESGIELSESLAGSVREAQGRLLGRAQEGMRGAEARLFEGMRQQARLEAEYRTIALQERTPLTLDEMRRAKEAKATMLKNSLQSFQFQDGQED